VREEQQVFSSPQDSSPARQRSYVFRDERTRESSRSFPLTSSQPLVDEYQCSRARTSLGRTRSRKTAGLSHLGAAEKTHDPLASVANSYVCRDERVREKQQVFPTWEQPRKLMTHSHRSRTRTSAGMNAFAKNRRSFHSGVAQKTHRPSANARELVRLPGRTHWRKQQVFPTWEQPRRLMARTPNVGDLVPLTELGPH
jgi:hypothetical protein